MKVTLKDVAREADCSFMAVSRVINNKQLNHVSPKLQERIREAVKKLNYQSNPVARALRTGRTHSIGMVVGKISGHTQACTAHALLNEVRKYGYQLNIVLTNYDKAEEERALEELLTRQSDGILFDLDLDPDSEIYQQLLKQKTPILLSHDPAHSLNTLAINGDKAFAEAFRVFHSHGHSRVAMFMGNNPSEHDKFRKFAEEYGVELVIFPHMPLRSSIRKSFEEFLSQDIPAVISTSNGIIQDLLRYIQEVKSPARPEYIYPYTLPYDYINNSGSCLGSIANPFREMIQSQAARLVKLIEKPDQPKRDIELSASLVTCEEIRELYLKQSNDPYYDIF